MRTGQQVEGGLEELQEKLRAGQPTPTAIVTGAEEKDTIELGRFPDRGIRRAVLRYTGPFLVEIGATRLVFWRNSEGEYYFKRLDGGRLHWLPQGAPYSLGRSPKSDYSIDDLALANRHLEVEVNPSHSDVVKLTDVSHDHRTLTTREGTTVRLHPSIPENTIEVTSPSDMVDRVGDVYQINENPHIYGPDTPLYGEAYTDYNETLRTARQIFLTRYRHLPRIGQGDLQGQSTQQLEELFLQGLARAIVTHGFLFLLPVVAAPGAPVAPPAAGQTGMEELTDGEKFWDYHRIRPERLSNIQAHYEGLRQLMDQRRRHFEEVSSQIYTLFSAVTNSTPKVKLTREAQRDVLRGFLERYRPYLGPGVSSDSVEQSRRLGGYVMVGGEYRLRTEAVAARLYAELDDQRLAFEQLEVPDLAAVFADLQRQTDVAFWVTANTLLAGIGDAYQKVGDAEGPKNLRLPVADDFNPLSSQYLAEVEEGILGRPLPKDHAFRRIVALHGSWSSITDPQEAVGRLFDALGVERVAGATIGAREILTRLEPALRMSDAMPQRIGVMLREMVERSITGYWASGFDSQLPATEFITAMASRVLEVNGDVEGKLRRNAAKFPHGSMLVSAGVRRILAALVERSIAKGTDLADLLRKVPNTDLLIRIAHGWESRRFDEIPVEELFLDTTAAGMEESNKIKTVVEWLGSRINPDVFHVALGAPQTGLEQAEGRLIPLGAAASVGIVPRNPAEQAVFLQAMLEQAAGRPVVIHAYGGLEEFLRQVGTQATIVRMPANAPTPDLFRMILANLAGVEELDVPAAAVQALRDIFAATQV